MAITSQMVKDLREKTGAGMMDCKKALEETGGKMEDAVDWLRKKGIATAAKKSSRVASQGKVVALGAGGWGVVVEVNTETDFAAKNEKFVAFADDVSKLALEKQPQDLAALNALAYPGTGRSVEEELKQLIATVGENMALRRYDVLSVQGVVAPYIHMGGKIGVIVALESDGPAEGLMELGKKVAMHVAASSPLFLDRGSVALEALERERAVLVDQARASGKPDNIIDKMVQGRIGKYYGEVCLVDQPFVMDPNLTVEQAVNAGAKELGTKAKVAGFVRFMLGEGVVAKEEE
ncbi:MAG: elongation factor Ts [Magnetococcales bacterium]|nr:elongation factor Ts [Magnetococcales bacterium]